MVKTREDVQALSGRALDIQVGVQVMGLELFSLEWPVYYDKAHETYETAPEDYAETEPGRWGRQHDAVYKWRGVTVYGNEYSHLIRIPDYSTEIEPAWLVIEHLGSRGSDRFPRGLSVAITGSVLDGGYGCTFTCRKWDHEFYAGRDTMPEAVCAAALLACPAREGEKEG